TLVHAAWALLLGRLGGTRDVVFGSVVSGRPPSLRGVESMVGLFITTLPCRVGLGNQRLAPWLAELRDDLLELRDYEHTPPVAIQSWSEVDSGSDLFDSLVVFENYPISGVASTAAGLEVLDTGAIERSHYPLSLQVVPEDAGILLLLHHDADRFEPTAAQRLIGHAEQLLAGLVGDGERRLDDLAMLSPAQTAQLTREWNDSSVVSNDSPVVSPKAQSVHRLISQQAQATPDAVAVVFESQTLSYRELDRRASHFGHRLRTLGIGRDETVGLAMERSLELPTAVLGILHTGAGYLPLDPDDPAERREYILADAGVAVLVASGAETTDASTAYRRIDFAAELNTQTEEAASPVDRVDDDGTAYLIYTSGSTGRPKGTVNVHRAVRNQVEWLQRRYPIGPTDRVLQKTPISFDVSVWELFWPLSVGACLVMARPGGHRDPAYLARTIGSHRITTTHFVPSMLQLFLEEPNIEVHAPTLRQVVVSGEALPLGLERRFFERLAVPLPNMYGPSEAARSSFYDCSLADTLPVAPIGRPTSNTALHIADRLLRQAPLGASGELLIGGAQLARGYHRRPGLTAQKFIPDPFGDQPGTRLYCSGDRVGFATDGRIEFLGRIDHQVKVRGVRVEPGEIEAILQQHSDIREAVVVTLGTGAQLRLCAVVVPATERTQSLDGLRDYLEGRLPLAAVPSHFEVLEELPLLPSGKADRVALTRRAESAGAGLSEDLRQAPRTPTEELLAGIWSNVLGLEPGTFGTDEDFFALGGHSLLATRVASRLRAAFDVELPLRTLFEASTVAELAREVEVTRAGALAVPPIEPRREPMPEAGWPASFAQERLWFLDQLDPGTPVFNLPSAIRLRGQLDIAALRAAFADLGQRHETLRTAFADAGGRPAQVIDEAFTGSIAEIDLASIEPSERHGTVRQLMRREAMRRFDLCHAPLVRATLLRLRADPADDHLLLLTLHHVISDGWSSAVLVREIGALYAAHAIGQPTPRPKLPVQYADFALWQRDWLTPSRMRTEIDYWRHRLEGAPPALELPTDRPRPAVFDHHGHSVQRRLDHPMAAKLRGLAQRRGATLFMVLSAAFAALLRRLSGQDDVALGAPIAGRTRAEIEGLVGFFVNSLVLRPDLPGDPTFADLLERTRHTALEAYEHQDLPFEKLVEALQPQRDPSRPPLFQAALVLQNAAPEPLELPGLELEPLIAERRQVQLELELEAVEGTFFEPDEAGLSLRLAYATRLFDETRMRRTLDQLVHLLQAAVHQPERRISEMALLSRVESQQILIEWSTPSEQGRNGGLPLELFDAWLQRTPEALAVVSDGPSGSASALTYAELDRRARRLARNFRRRGIGREAVVAVAMERAPELVVALLAILRSGGAFLPLNPKDPSQRLRTVLRDARASLLLTQTRLATELVDLPCEHLCLDGKRPADFERDGMSPLLPPVIREQTVIREQAAYVIYTSGSTGKPKGVVISHGALGRLLRYRAATVTTADAKLHKTALSFDVAVAEIFLPLVSGGRTVLARPGGAQDGPYLARLIRRQRVSLAVFPPALLGSLLEQGSLADCPSLRLVGVGGEAVPGELPGRFAAASRAALWNRYGPTEATIFATEGRADTDEAGHCLPIGRPAAGARAVLLDRRLRPVPAGVTGEICLAGPTLARGYLGRPAATAAAFVPDASQAGRLYRTGDLGRQQADGTLEFLGRRDAQVKIRGFRVELGEVEAILARLASVREVVVTVDEGPIPSSRRLLAYVVPATASASPAELRRAARERLPDYMVPAQVVLLDALPRT
ncbi:MAG: amino acid adenylation domain-containing protein, partial [Acidobacteriota bacterium]